MSWIIAFQLLATLTEFLIVYIFYKDFIGDRKIKNIFVYVLFAVLYLTIATLFSMYQDGAIGIFKVVTMISFFIVVSLLFRGDPKIKLFANFLLCGFMMLSDWVAMIVVSWLRGINFSNLINNDNLMIIVTIISKFILYILVKPVCAVRRKDHTRLPLIYWIALVSIPIISSFTVYLFYDLTYRTNAIGVSPFLLLISLGLILVNGVTFQLFESLLEKTALEIKGKLQQQHIEAQISHYETIISEQQSRRSFRHDLKNNIELIHNLIESGNVNKALENMKKLVDISAIDKEYVHTGNAVIDAIFNAKIRLAESKGIDVRLDNIIVPSDLPVNSTDMCILFTNSFDNAIEACDRLSECEKYITVGLMRRKENLVYKITNPTNGNLVKGKKHFFTSKQDKEVHGIGIESMEKVLEKYDGLLSLEHNDSKFELGFIIPCV